MDGSATDHLPDEPPGAATPWVRHHPTRVGALVLALVAGYVDAFGFLVLFGAFVGHMSGNVVGGIATLALDDRVVTFQRLLAIPAFIVGIAAGQAIIEVLRRRGRARLHPPVLVLEATLLAAFTGAGFLFAGDAGYRPDTWRLYLLTVLAAMAMGVQTANLERVESVSLHTTFISGSITAVTVNAVGYLFARGELRRDPTSPTARSRLQATGHAFAIVGSTIATFALGAAAAAFARQPLGYWAMLPAIAALLALAVVLPSTPTDA